MYTEGLQETVPYAPPKFRSHAGSTSSENEKRHLRDITIFRVQTQVKIMQDSVTEWKARMAELDTEIERVMSQNETIREPMSRKIEVQTNMARAKAEKESIGPLKIIYNKEKARGGDDFLLKVIRQYDDSTGFPSR